MTPLEAVVSGPEGEPGAIGYGWQPPYPPVGPLVRRWLRAEAVTDGIAGRAFAVLCPDERLELADLLVKAVDARRAAPLFD
jgi:hypothetical protein